MSQQVATAYVNQFSANVMMLAQQTESRLVNLCRRETLTGEFGYFDQYGSVEAVERTSRHADTPMTELPQSRRRVSAQDWELSDIVDKQDTNRMLMDPQAAIVKAFAAGMNRRKDTVWMAAFFGTAFTGKAGGTSTSFAAANQVAVDYVESGSATNSSLTIGKLRRARELLMDAEIGEGALNIACSQREINALLRTTEVASADYNTVKALVNGEVNTFMGFTFVRVPSARLLVNGSSNRRLPVWHEDGILFAAMEEPITKAAEDPTKGFNTRVYMRASFGATRMEEARCVEIIAHPTSF